MKIIVKYHNDSNYQCIYDNEGEFTGRMTPEHYYEEFENQKDFEEWTKSEYDLQTYTGFGIDEVTKE